ncbi:MAG TPA: hypothetical protein DEO57_07190 [Phycisphaerales bacterium]|nr:hypothetical protein [Phycisphaerales bacterium]
MNRTIVERIHRRGVATVLAMMFLVVFGALAATMAVVAQGNMRTAHSALRVSRSLSAAESGLVFARRRLARESSRFIVEKGVIDSSYGAALWFGTTSVDDGVVTVLEPDGYVVPSSSGTGLMHAVYDAHRFQDDYPALLDEGVEVPLLLDEDAGSIATPPVRLGNEDTDPYFLLRYDLLDDGRFVRVTSQGVDDSIRRTLQMDFRLDKRIEYAVLSPNRIMIGKNVLVEGPIGSLYGIGDGELSTENGDPLVLRSDFYDLGSETLDARLDTFYGQLAVWDADGDNRLRPNHPVESEGLVGFPELQDWDGDEYIDDFDLFLDAFDQDGDGMVVYDEAMADAAGYAGVGQEFAIDGQLGSLIDGTIPDRDGDGVLTPTGTDRALGYRDGILDARDFYAKVHGRLAFAVSEEAWESSHGAGWQSVVQGPVRAWAQEAPSNFEVGEPELVEVTTDMFLNATSWFEVRSVLGEPFGDAATGQVGDNLAAGGGIEYVPASESQYEDVPYGSAGAYDWYRRPVYRGMRFEDVRIPVGTNALFEDCRFVGVTWVETETDCGDPNWNYAGSIEPDGAGGFQIRFPSMAAESSEGDIPDTRLVSNSIRFHDCTFLGSLCGDRPDAFTHWRNKIQLTGNTRFYVDPLDPDLLAQADATELAADLTGLGYDVRAELAKSSILMPGWSVDVGNFDNIDGARIKLTGIIVAGVMDIRGTALVNGTLMMTFRPTVGEGPLFYGGSADAFNTTIGYFGPEEGDGEGSDPADPSFSGFGEIVLRYDEEASLPDGIPWPVSLEPEPGTYWEGGAL